MMSGQNQPGFFGSLLGGVLGQQMQNGGGMGMGTMAAGAML